MIVKNTAERIIVIPLDNSTTRVHRLLMGWSPISDEDWKGAAPHVQGLLTDGVLVELGTVEEKDGKGKPFTRPKILRDLSQTEATKLLNECYDVKALEAWRDGTHGVEQETRESVRVVLQDRIKAMTDRSPTDAATAAKNSKAK